MSTFLRFELDVEHADAESRTLEGTVVPYDVAASLSGVSYRFRPGSIRLPGARRVPLLLGHDRNQPVGVLVELTETPGGARGRFVVDRTPGGDVALAQAASGSRAGFSVGALADRIELAADGSLDVHEAELVETSLVTIGGYADATVDRIAAADSRPFLCTVDESGGLAAELTDGEPQPDAEPEPEPAEPGEPEPDDDDDDDDNPADEPETDEEGDDMSEATVEAAADAAVMIRAAADPVPALSAGGFARHLVMAQHGEAESRRLIEAALTETLSTDIAGLLPPTYERDVLGGKTVDRVLYELFRGKALPGVGLAVQKPTWTTRPAGAWAANVDADATTSKAVIGLNAAAVERWDWATAVSYVAVQRSDPDALDTMYREAVVDFYDDVETKIATALDGAGTTDAATTIGAGIAAFYSAFGKSPDVIVVAPDVWGDMADAEAIAPPIGLGTSDVSAGGGGLRGSFAGLPIVATGKIAPGARYLASRRALDVRISEPVRLTANAIGALNVELGVVGEGLFDVDYPEVIELTAAAFMSARSSRKSS